MVGEHEYHPTTTGALREPDEAPLARRLLAEFVGTLIFVAVGTGAASVLLKGPIEAFQSLPPQLRGAPGNTEIFSTLLGNSLGDLLSVALAFATALAVLVYAMGGVSGAHFNPAVTFALAVSRRFRWGDVFPYWIVQCLGAIGGAFVVAGIYGQAAASAGGTDIFFGATLVADGIDWPRALLSEAFIGFVLMTAIMAVAIDPRAPKGWSGLIIGLALAGGILVTGAATGGSANFARSLGPLVASLLYDTGEIPWGDIWIYAVGPIIGASAAALIYESVTGLETDAPSPEPGAATHDDAAFRPPAGSGGAVVTTTGETGTPPGLAPTGEDPATGPTTPPGL